MTICIKCKMEHDKCCSGQAFTKYACEKCGKEQYWHNTDTPSICEECSEKYNICERCGQPITRK